jgi:hypothetical protein
VTIRLNRPDVCNPAAAGDPPAAKSRIPDLIQDSGVDRRLAQKNLRTGLIAGAIIFVVFAAAWVSGYIY